MFEEFMEFMTARQEAAANSEDDNDEVEVWDKDGRGARVKKKDAKPFLQTLGILLDPKTEGDDSDTDGKDKGKSRPTGRTAGNAATTGAATSTVKKYFSKSK